MSTYQPRRDGARARAVRHPPLTWKKKRSWPVSRVLSWTAIPLGPGSLQASSHLPASSAGRVIARLFGVAPGRGCRVSPPRHPRSSRARRRTRLCGPVPRLRHPHLLRCGSKHASGELRLRNPPTCETLLPCGSKAGRLGGRVLPATVPCGARTFLCSRSGAKRRLIRAQRLSGQLHPYSTAGPGMVPGDAGEVYSSASSRSLSG